MITRVRDADGHPQLALSSELLADAGIAVGDSVDVRARNGVLVITPLRHLGSRVDLASLVDTIPADNTAGELDWGPKRGTESW